MCWEEMAIDLNCKLSTISVLTKYWPKTEAQIAAIKRVVSLEREALQTEVRQTVVGDACR